MANSEIDWHPPALAYIQRALRNSYGGRNMYAIVEVRGEQVKLEPGKEVLVPYLGEKNEGETIILDKVMLISGDTEPIVGSPTVEGASVKAIILDAEKGDKVIVFKKKRRTGYHLKKGHRQQYSRLKVEEIIAP